MMERRDGCFLHHPAGDAWRLGRIMLKYRPIAPKPAASSAPVSPPEETLGSGKRKGVARVDGRRGRKARRVSTQKETKSSNEDENNVLSSGDNDVVTLPLMPITPERKEGEPHPHGAPSPTSSDETAASCFLQPPWEQLKRRVAAGEAEGRVVAPRPVRPAGSWVTVERVTETWGEEGWFYFCNDEVVKGVMEGDGCPCFVSDALGRVTWTNTAYRRMVVEEEEEVEVRVALVTRGLVPVAGTCTAFSCRVSVRYACRRRGKVTLAAPCDVWCLSDGGLAWRVDLKAALSLSLGR